MFFQETDNYEMRITEQYNMRKVTMNEKVLFTFVQFTKLYNFIVILQTDMHRSISTDILKNMMSHTTTLE